MIATAPPLLRVRNWASLYENNRSRELGRTAWFPAPNDLGADWYAELVAHEAGAAHLGGWYAVLMVASRAKPRGSLVRDDGKPHTAESLARLTRLPEQVVTTAIERLLKIGLLEIGGNKPRKKSELRSHPRAATPQDAAPESQEGAVEGKGTEHHHQEGNGKEKKGKRTAPQRTEPTGSERATDELTPTPFGAVGASAPASSQRGADDDENAPTQFASPDDELKAIFRAKAGEPITISVLDGIRVNLEVTGVSMEDFVAEVRKHVANDWRNPAGFLRDLSRRFRAKTRPADPPITAAEAAARDYRCPVCSSRTPGEGARIVDGKEVPCSCASPEYIARQRARGIFPREVK